jgi:DNA-binding CsgD family transcriptional regulator
MEQLYRRTLEQGDESSLPFLLFEWGELECWAGNWDRAARYALEGHERAEQTGLELQKSAMLYVRALVDAHLGRVDAARSAAQEGLRRGERSASRACTGSSPTNSRRWSNSGTWSARSGSCDRSRSRPPRPDGDGRWRSARGAEDCCARPRATRRGALRTLNQSLEHHRHLPMPFELGRTLLVAGTVQRRAKHQRAARETLSQALGIFDRLGAPLWAAKASSELDRIGGRAPGTRELTPSEDRVARLVADGLTNREVAAALFVSVATVESALWKIYRKLGVRSRTELALRLGSKPGSGAR